LFSSRHFFISVSTSIGTKKGRIYIKGASFNGEPQTFGGKFPQNFYDYTVSTLQSSH